MDNLHSIYIQFAHCERAVVSVVQAEAIFHIGQSEAVSVANSRFYMPGFKPTPLFVMRALSCCPFLRTSM